MNIRYPIYEGVYRILTLGKTYTFFLYHTYPNYREALKNYPIKTLFRYITLKKV